MSCPITSPGPAGLPCLADHAAGTGHLWVATDVPDRHEEGVDEH